MIRRDFLLTISLAIFVITTHVRAQRPDVIWQVGGHRFRVDSVKFSAGGQRVISASEDGTLKIWDASTGDLQLTLTVPTDNFRSAFAFYDATIAPEGDTIWGASIGGAYQFRLSDGAFLQSIIAMESCNQVFFSPDGQYLAMAGSPAGTEDATYVYRRSDGHLLHMFDPASSVAAVFTADSQFLIAGTSLGVQSPGGVIRYYRLSDGGIERTINAHSDDVTWIALSPDGATFASSSRDGTAKLWNTADGSLLHTLTGHTDGVSHVAFSPDGSIIATSSFDGTLRTWNPQTGAAIDTFTPLDGVGVGTLSWAPDGQSLVVAPGADFGQPTPRIRRIASADGSLIRDFTQIFGPYNDMDLSPDGSRIVFCEYPTRFEMFDAADGAPIWSGGSRLLQSFVAFTPDSTQLAVGRPSGDVDFLDVNDGSTISSFPAHGDRIADIAFSPDGSLMGTRCGSEPSRIWTYPNLSVQSSVSLPLVAGAGFDFSPDSSMLAVAVRNAVSLFDTSDGSFLRSFNGHTSSTLAVDVGPDNQLLLSGSTDRTAKIWDLQSGAVLHTLPHDNWVRAVAFSPDGRIAATGTVGVDRSLRLWDVETGDLLVRYTVDMGLGPQGIEFSADGQTIFCGRADGALIAIRNPFAFAPGDVNADGVIDASDAIALAAALVGNPLGDGDTQRADVNHDGRADGEDVAAWVALVVGG